MSSAISSRAFIALVSLALGTTTLLATPAAHAASHPASGARTMADAGYPGDFTDFLVEFVHERRLQIAADRVARPSVYR